MGLMQIMPKTYAELRARHRLGPDAYDPRDNILAGAAYLREMLDRYGSPGFLAAYNAGPLRYDQHLATGRPLPAGDANLCRDALADDRRPAGRKPRRRLFRCSRLGPRGAVRYAFGAVAERRIVERQSAGGSFIAQSVALSISRRSRRTRRACLCVSPAGSVDSERNRMSSRCGGACRSFDGWPGPVGARRPWTAR